MDSAKGVQTTKEKFWDFFYLPSTLLLRLIDRYKGGVGWGGKGPASLFLWITFLTLFPFAFWLFTLLLPLAALGFVLGR